MNKAGDLAIKRDRLFKIDELAVLQRKTSKRQRHAEYKLSMRMPRGHKQAKRAKISIENMDVRRVGSTTDFAHTAETPTIL